MSYTHDMRLLARSVGCLALVLVPVVAFAQGAAPSASAPAPPPPGGSAPPASSGTGAAPADNTPKSTGDIGGATFSDKPVRHARRRSAPRRAGPRATFPGFEQLPDGGSRFFVHLSQSVPVEEHRAAGSLTYVLHGAHLRVRNDAHPLVTVHFNTPVFRARLTPRGKDLLFVLEMRSAAAATFKMNENQDKTSTLQIDFPKGDFIKGDGSERLPGEAARPNARGKASRGKKRAPAPPPAAPSPAKSEPEPTP